MSDILHLLHRLIADAKAREPDHPPLIGLAGAQGSGKSYICHQLVEANPHVAHFSLDDVYLTKVEREQMAKRFHPLFSTRGPPGTHALGLALSTIAALRAAGDETETLLPRFDKARDDRAPENQWRVFVGRPEAIIIDGWCIGALPDNLGDAPLNALEAQEDLDGRWRALVRADIADRYQLFFQHLDASFYLQAPSWEIVKSWRAEQEVENLGRPLSSEDHARLDRFMMYYERITRSMMVGGHCANTILTLDECRAVTGVF